MALLQNSPQPNRNGATERLEGTGHRPGASGAPRTYPMVRTILVPKLGGKLPPRTARLAVPPGTSSMPPDAPMAPPPPDRTAWRHSWQPYQSSARCMFAEDQPAVGAIEGVAVLVTFLPVRRPKALFVDELVHAGLALDTPRSTATLSPPVAQDNSTELSEPEGFLPGEPRVGQTLI